MKKPRALGKGRAGLLVAADYSFKADDLVVNRRAPVFDDGRVTL